MASVDWSDNDESRVKDGFCERFYEAGNVGNCVISACNNRGDGVSQPLNVMAAPTNYGLVKDYCKPDGAGGEAPIGSSHSIIATNNANYAPSTPSRVKRAAVGSITSEIVTIEEVRELAEQAKQANGLHKRVCNMSIAYCIRFTDPPLNRQLGLI